MVNEAILGALKSALERKESLKKAMMTLYNAGYKKEEISEAAQIVNQPSSIPQTQLTQQVQQKPSLKSTIKMLGASKSDKKSKKQPQQVSQYLPTQQLAPTTQQPAQQPQIPQQQIPQQPQQLQAQQPMQQQPAAQNTPQNVSGYGQPPKPGSKTTIIILGFVLLFLLGTLVTIFLFKDELLNFFNNLFN